MLKKRSTTKLTAEQQKKARAKGKQAAREVKGMGVLPPYQEGEVRRHDYTSGKKR